MPASRLPHTHFVDGRQLINMAANKVGDLKQLSEIIGYGYESLLAIRNNGMLTKKLQKKIQKKLS